ncbi:hypothetical protein [Hymenobacter nivis]|uniref:Uncharacterized protein n=1 Tax=Hymenobacter nivis TaxID=1850093 RepID=A0A502GYH4_9BACT|nr:hypothetical protein [Hymenobacter nivis]TPG66096.1 hypothetical protein EAH73_12055 [Hymenobacter nivis]
MDTKPLLPSLRSALMPKEALSLADGFQAGDLLHLAAAVAHRPTGTVLPVLGQCRCLDAQGRAWRLLAYVPASPQECTTYSGRTARRFPEEGQQEQWFGTLPAMLFTEIDVTDYAEALRLERCVEAKVIAMYPKTGPALRQAA